MEQHGSVRPGARWVRGWLAASLSTFCAGVSHYIVDVSAPDLVVLACALAMSGVVCGLLAGRRMGPARVAAAVALSQGAYHALFSVSATRFSAVAGESMTSHVHHGVAMASGVQAHGGMLSAHVLAGVITFWVLRHGEKSWWALVDALRTEIGVVLAVVLPLIPAARPLRRTGEFFLPVLQDTGWVRGAISRRGPPAPVV